MKPDRVVDEAERHLRFADERDRKFDKQTAVEVLDLARKYLEAGNNGKLFVISGKSGAGDVVFCVSLQLGNECLGPGLQGSH